MITGKIQRLLARLVEVFQRLGVEVSDRKLETIAVNVYSAMGTPTRQFHNLDHVFAFSENDPLEDLAVIFHDVVYLGVDKGWPSTYAEVLNEVFGAGTEEAALSFSSEVPYYENILRVFGLSPGDSLPGSGTNELASAFAASLDVGELLGQERTLELAACIEATIAFRDEESPFRLSKRLVELGFSSQGTQKAVCRAIHMANADVSDFRHRDTSFFLSNTWKLLPELNPDLRIGEQFSIASYRKALEGMEKFLSFLTPEKIFHHWENEPGATTLQDWKSQARFNLAVACEYLGAKLLAAGLLEAFALATGGDAPLPLFMGPSSADEGTGDRLEDFLPETITPARSGKVWDLLEKGRLSETNFDLKNSPLAAFVYRNLDSFSFDREVVRAKSFFRGDLSPEVYLEGWTPAPKRSVAKALHAFVPTRRKALTVYLA